MATTPKAVQLSTLVAYLRRKSRRTMNTSSRRSLALAVKCFDQFGDCTIYADKELRDMVADSVAHRLALSRDFTRGRFDELHRRTNYDDQGRESGDQHLEGEDRPE